MATSSFDKEFIITEEKTVEQLLDMLENGTPVKWDRGKFKNRDVDAGLNRIKEILDKGKDVGKGCEYCEREVSLGKEFHGDELCKYIWIESNDLMIEIHVNDTGKSYIDAKTINFCPMCGTELEKTK